MYENSCVKIPVVLFLDIINLLESIEAGGAYDFVTQEEYGYVLCALRKKKEALALREAYSLIIHAKDDDSRHSARMHYLQQKRGLNEG